MQISLKDVDFSNGHQIGCTICADFTLLPLHKFNLAILSNTNSSLGTLLQ